MGYEGEGDMKNIVEEWQRVFDALQNITVIQRQSMSGVASLYWRNKEFVFEVGNR